MAGNKPFNKQQAEPRERDPQVAGLKVPPHSIEAEQSVLGGLMLDNERWDDVAERGSRRFLHPPTPSYLY